MAHIGSFKTRLCAAGLAGLASGIARVSVWLHNSWEMTGRQFWLPAAILVGLITLFLWLMSGMFSGAIEITEPPPRYRFAAVVLAGISIFLFGVVAVLFQQEYRIAVNPRVMGRIERTWIIVRGNHDQHVRVADLTFTVTDAGQPINCEADAVDIGDGTYDAKAGDSIELSPTPNSCTRPYVINVQPPTWVMGTLSAVVVAAGFFSPY